MRRLGGMQATKEPRHRLDLGRLHADGPPRAGVDAGFQQQPGIDAGKAPEAADERAGTIAVGGRQRLKLGI